MTFLEIAKPMAERGVPIIPLRPKSKIALLPDWPNKATTDIAVIEEWAKQFPDANGACVAQAKPDGFWMFEVDSPDLPSKIESELGMVIKTFRVRSSPGRGHYYFRQTPSSLAMGNVAQNFVRDHNFSARVDKEYVVAANSLHPTSGRLYEVVSTHEIIPAPEALIEWIIRQRLDSGPKPEAIDLNVDSKQRIPRGTHDVTLTAIAGKLRSSGIEEETMYLALVEVCEKRCDDYGPDYKEMCRKIAKSISRYEPKEVIPTFFGNRQIVLPPSPQVEIVSGVPSEELEEQPTFTLCPHPKFPTWVLQGTSIYNGLVKPYCDVNSRIDYFMWMPAFALLLNYIGTKVNIYMKNVIPSLFMVLVGRRGETMKSSSVQDAITYFRHMGLADHAGAGTKNAEGKILIWTVGSPEGLGVDVQRTNCRNICLAYDELSMLTNKAGIESSGLVSALLSLYESAKFQNKIKSGKESYSIEPGTYCATLLACSTDKNFLPNWSKLSGDSTGLDDRFIFIYQPETFREPLPQVAVNTMDGALETRKLIDMAVKQGVYRITDDSPLAHQMRTRAIDNREGIRVEKFALGFAVELQKTEIDEECIERSLALVKYEKDVKKYLAPFEASTMQGAIQMELITYLKKNNGAATWRDVNRSMHPERMGTDVWTRAYSGLINLGYLKSVGAGTKSDPHKLVLLRAPESDED